MNEPAFPCYRIEYGDDKKTPPQQGYWQEVTLRDYFAAKAMQAWIIALSNRRSEAGYTDNEIIFKASRLGYEQANEMLKSRTEPKGE